MKHFTPYVWLLLLIFAVLAVTLFLVPLLVPLTPAVEMLRSFTNGFLTAAVLWLGLRKQPWEVRMERHRYLDRYKRRIRRRFSTCIRTSQSLEEPSHAQ